MLCSHCWSSDVDIHVQSKTEVPCDPRQLLSCFNAFVEVIDHACSRLKREEDERGGMDEDGREGG